MSKKKTDKKQHKTAPEIEKKAEETVGTDVKVEVEDKKEPTLEEKLENLEKDVAVWKDRYMRNMAEFENFRRRSQKEKSDWIKTATEGIVISLCDVMDNFERAWEQVEEDELEKPFIKGVKQIEQQLNSILSKEGVKKVDSKNQEFNPEYHEALAHIPSELEENIVAAVIQNGYTLNGKLIRPARVAVSNGAKPQPVENKKEKKK